MGAPLPQASFVGGELGPTLHARVDLQRYAQGLAKCRNFVVHPHGGAANRPGFEAVGYTAASEPPNQAAGNDFIFPPSRLWRFQRSAESHYVLEFGPGYIRFYQDGAIIRTSFGNIYTVATPYGVADIFRLQFAQSVDVVRITHPSHDPMDLQHRGPADWVLGLTPFVDYGKPVAVFTSGGITESAMRDWQWVVAGVDKDGRESLPVVMTLNGIPGGTPLVLHTGPGPSQPQPIRITVGDAVHHYNIYKGLDGVWGLVGTAPAYATDVPGATERTFYDFGYAPDYTQQPRQYDPRFRDGSTRPACCAFFQQRAVYANMVGAPDTFAASETGNYGDFALYVPATASNPLRATLASGQLDEIRALVPLKALLAFTAGAEYVITGDNGVLTPNNPLAQPVSFRGSGWLPPLIVGNVVVFYDAAGHVREWVFDQNVDGYPAADLGLLASHLFEGRTVVDWCLVQAPETLLWLVLDDGVLLSLTYNREQSVAAWARHNTAGRVLSVCSVREGRGDSVYAIIEREVGNADNRVQFIERMRARSSASPFLDCATEGIGPSQLAAGATLTGGTTWDVGDVVQFDVDDPLAPPHGDLWGPANLEHRISIPTGDGAVVGQVVGYAGTALTLELMTPVPEELRGVLIKVWYLTSRTFSGLEALANTELAVMADGEPHPAATPNTAGVLTLERFAHTVLVGFPYHGELETLPLTFQGDALQSKKKMVSSVGAIVRQARGLSFGQTGGELQGARQEGFLSVTPQDGAIDPVTIDTTWNRHGKVTLTTTPGLPAEVLALIPEVTVSG